MLSMQIRGILFDIGDTLLAATRLQQFSLEETARALVTEKWIDDSESFVQAYQMADKEPQFEEAPDLNHLYSDERIVARAFKLLALPFNAPRAERFLQLYRGKIRENLKPDTRLIKLLDDLRAQEIKLGIVSNGTTVEQLDQLTRLHIKDYFDPILISEEVGFRKPDPNIFLLAVQHWGLPPAEILVVGDRADWDVLGAAQVGMRSALTTQFVDHRKATSSNVKPDLIISNLSHLLDSVRRLNEPTIC